MATLTPADTHTHDDHHGDYITCSKGIMSWLITLDHKRIGVMYVIATLASFLLGGLFALGIRTELIAPGETIMDADTYNRFFTLHGAIMTFLVIIPAIPGALGNFVLPIMLGAKDVAFPPQPHVVLPVGAWCGHDRVFHAARRHRHRLDLLHALFHRRGPPRCLLGGHGCLHPRLLVDFHRSELHRDRAATASPPG